MENKEQLKIEMKTLVSCLNTLSKQGFTANYKVVNDKLKSLDTNQVYDPDKVKVVNFYRFEGESDPADNSILYAIETNDGRKGTLVDAFGPYSDSKVTHFMQQVEEISKKTDKDAPL